MVSKTLPSLKSILELLLSSLRSTWLLFTDFLGSVSCNSSSFNSQKSRVLLSSRCLIFKVLALSISFSLSASLERLTILPHSLQFVKHFFRIFFAAFFVHRSGSDFQPFFSEFFELSLERSDIIPHPPLIVNTFFRVFSFSFQEGPFPLSFPLFPLCTTAKRSCYNISIPEGKLSMPIFYILCMGRLSFRIPLSS